MVTRAGARRRSPFLVPAILVLLLVIVVALRLAGVYTDLLWFREVGASSGVGYSRVFNTILKTRILLFFLFGALMAALVGANLFIAYRLRPPFRAMSLEQQAVERYRVLVEPYLRRAFIAGAIVIGVFAGLGVSTQWRVWLTWRNAAAFGVKDATFHRDVSYFAYTYPFQRMVLGFLFSALLLSLIAAAAVHYLFGGIRLQSRGEKVIAAAKAHLSVLLGLIVLLKAFAYRLDTFGLAFSDRGVVKTGASYTDVHARLPGLRLLTVISLICAVLFIANLRSRGWGLPAVAFGLLILSSVLVGGIYPAIVQQLRVRPNEVKAEAPYIARNIAATRDAYDLNEVSVSPYAAKTTVTPAQLRADKTTIPNARLLDPSVLKKTFEQLQGIKGYYRFPTTLDIDRYTDKGDTQDYVVGLRELDQSGLAADQQNWLNQHLIFTHGYGFVATPANRVDIDGKPVFTEGDIPPHGFLRIDQPRIYYGEATTSYAVVGTSQPEFDRPTGTAGGQESFNYVTGGGKGGVSVGGFGRRLLYSLRYRDKNLLLSSAMGKDSRILYIRKPVDRVRKVAPYLKFDTDPYPAVIDGRTVWIVDGYTTSNSYPYAERLGFGTATTDARGNLQTPATINYIRNSVKATVDAFDGTVTLYRWDEDDPVLKTWESVFPGTVQPRSAMSASLLAHVRYPEDLFKVQRELLGRYHVTDARDFYSKQDFWSVPSDPTVQNSATKQPPYFLFMQVPGQRAAQFNLTSAMVPRGKENLAAFISVSGDQADYGRIRVLQLPSETTINGPAQVVSRFESNTQFSRDQTQLSGGTSDLRLGNLLTLPVGGGLLYIQPVYVESRGVSGFPQLRRVLVGFGDKIGYADTLREALEQALGAGAGGAAQEPGTNVSSGGGAVSADLLAALRDAQKAYDDGQAALRRGDFTAYGEAQSRLADALRRATAASRRSGSPSPSPSRS
ncbi:MAG: UPF0182 family protein [Frankia sp.]|nr:UPF0182 family protein [Frankia sp.]